MRTAAQTQIASSDELKAQQRMTHLRLRWDEVQRNMGPRYTACTFDNFRCETDQQRAVWQAIRDYMREFPSHMAQGEGLLLYGPRGSGKSHLAAAALSVSVRVFGALPMWSDGQKLFARMRDTIGGDTSEEAALAPYVSADVLLLDDPIPGAADRAVTDFQQSVLWRIIDGRYRNRRPVWATCNVTSEAELVSRLGGQLADRLIDGALCLKCNWPSIRKPLP